MSFNDPTSLTVNVLTPEQDYFYWPCMSGEKYAPTFAAASGSLTFNGYTSLGVYPTVSQQATAGNGVGSITWPVVPSWKYSGASFNGLTIAFRANVGASNTGCGLQVNLNSSDFILIFVNGQIQGSFAGNSFTLASLGNVLQNTWYNVALTVSSAGAVAISVTVNGTTYASTVPSSRVGVDALALTASTYEGGAVGSVVRYYISQLQVTYS